MDDFPELTIGEVAERGGVATSAIRYYESIGLLPEPERLYGQRRYHEDVLGRLAFIAVARAAGFKLREIRELVAGVEAGGQLSGSMRSLSAEKLDEVEALLERTKAMKGWLELARECDCQTPADCTLFPIDGEPAVDPQEALTVVRAAGGGCRREGLTGHP